MDARVILSDETAHQESNKTKILKWMQAHPEACKNTSSGTLARQMARDFSTKNSIATLIPQMVNAHAIFRSGSHKKANYAINYLHQWVTPEIRMNASDADKKRIKGILEKVDEETTLSEDGCLVHRTEAVKEDNGTDEATETLVPVKVTTMTEHGVKQVSITITLNLNI